MLIQSGTASTGTVGIFANVFLANSPQVVLSLIYFSYNSVVTSMLLNHEFAGYQHNRKGLRVSSTPVGMQRSKYILQLPFRYGIPLMVFSILIHWLASQSIFVVVVEVYNMFNYHSITSSCFQWPSRTSSLDLIDRASRPAYCGEDFITCAYSPLGILLTLVMVVVLFLILGGLGMRKVRGGGMPVVGSNSLAIAAACHARLEEIAPEESAVQWGAFDERERGENGIIIGHCGFSSGEVNLPRAEAWYG